MSALQRNPVWGVAAVLGLLSAALWLLGACVGSTGLESLSAVFQDSTAWQIVWELRLPRTLGAWAAGALLGLAGAIAQGLFRNPLADPYLLGSASGASLGVALAMALFGVSPLATAWVQRLGLTGAAFAGAVGAVLLTLTLARGLQQTLRLLLGGVVVGVVLGAASSLVLLAVPEVMQAMQAFLMGSTSLVGWNSTVLMLLVWGVCLGAAWAMSPVLDGLALGEATALSLGLPLARLRGALVLVLALATGTAVAHTGLIAFVGLAAPHLVRSLVHRGVLRGTLRGSTHGGFLLLSSLAGAVLLLAADLLARGLMAPQELPVGVLTAVLGGGYLLWLMHRGHTSAGGGV